MEPIDLELDEGELELPSEPMHLTWAVAPCDARDGAHRPRALGETILKADVQIGYLHRGFEKIVRARHVGAGLPVHRPAELRVADVEQRGLRHGRGEALRPARPERCQWYRMILGELARIADHLTCTGAMAMELGRSPRSSGFWKPARSSTTSSKRRPAPGSRTPSDASVAWPARRRRGSRISVGARSPGSWRWSRRARSSSSRIASSSIASRASERSPRRTPSRSRGRAVSARDGRGL